MVGGGGSIHIACRFFVLIMEPIVRENIFEKLINDVILNDKQGSILQLLYIPHISQEMASMPDGQRMLELVLAVEHKLRGDEGGPTEPGDPEVGPQPGAASPAATQTKNGNEKDCGSCSVVLAILIPVVVVIIVVAVVALFLCRPGRGSSEMEGAEI